MKHAKRIRIISLLGSSILGLSLTPLYAQQSVTLMPEAANPRGPSPVMTVQPAAKLQADGDRRKDSLGQLPDLSISSFSTTPGQLAVGAKVVSILGVKNQGTRLLRRVRIQLLNGSTVVQQKYIDLPANQVITEKWSTTLTHPGAITFTAVVDPDNRIAESNERNNRVGKRVEIRNRLAQVPSARPTTPGNDRVQGNQGVESEHLKQRGRQHAALDAGLMPGHQGGSSTPGGGSRYGQPGGLDTSGMGGGKPPPGRANDGLPDFQAPNGLQNPSEKITRPEDLGSHTPMGSTGDLYGGVIPSRDPRSGGGKGNPGSGDKTDTDSYAFKVAYVYGLEDETTAEAAEIKSTRTLDYVSFYHITNEGTQINTYVFNKSGDTLIDIQSHCCPI